MASKAPKPKKGFIKIMQGKFAGKQIDILYFPPEYTMEKANTFSEISIPGLESPYLQYVKGNAASITLEIFYDTYESGTDVREFTDKLTKLMYLDEKLHAPPPLRFIWGDPVEPFDCVLERVSKKFTLFKSPENAPEKAIPVRARLSITLKEWKTELNEREMKLQSADKTKSYIVKQGDSLWSIANREYGNPSKWRHIAGKNKIDNPRLLEPGMELVMPPLE
jgi:nucleoid-associated protein YgaU